MTGHHHAHGGAAASGGVNQRTALTIALGLTTVVLLAEAVGAWWTGSLSLLADAGHMLADVAGLSMALAAVILSARPASDTRTWGYRRAEVLAAAAQAAVLLGVGVYVVVEALRRLLDPPEVASAAMAVLGAVGLLGNVVAIAVLSRVRDGGLNARAAMLEVVNDALGSVAVLVAAGVIALTGWLRADAVASLAIGVLIIPRTLALLRETVDVLLESTPRGVDLAQVRAHLLELPHVRGVHDLHASSVTSDLPVLTAHLVVDDECFSHGDLPGLLDQVQGCVAGHFDVDHSTFQFEPAGHADHEHTDHA